MIYKSLKAYIPTSCLASTSSTANSAVDAGSNNTSASRSRSSTRRTTNRAPASATITGAASNAPRPLVHFSNAQRRRAQLSTSVKLYARNTTNATSSPIPLNLPRFLARPAYAHVGNEALRAIHPDLENVPVHFVRDVLRETGDRFVFSSFFFVIFFLQLLNNSMLEDAAATTTQATPGPSTGIPREIKIKVTKRENREVPVTPPTHVLAVYQSPAPVSIPGAKAPARRVTLVPTHSAVLAVNCASLPAFPASAAAEGRQSDNNDSEDNTNNTTTSTYTVPVVSMGIPSPDTFVALSAYLYTGRTDQLFKHFMPCTMQDLASVLSQPSSSPSPTSPSTTSTSTPPTVNSLLAARLAATLEPHQLLAYAVRINGLWRNVCSLGVFDETLWRTMDLMWEVIVGAMEKAGRR